MLRPVVPADDTDDSGGSLEAAARSLQGRAVDPAHDYGLLDVPQQQRIWAIALAEVYREYRRPSWKADLHRILVRQVAEFRGAELLPVAVAALEAPPTGARRRGGGGPPMNRPRVDTVPRTIDDLVPWLRLALPNFGTIREGQGEVILHARRGRRVLFVAPTGHGKSLCYQALARSPWSTGVVLVFQPLKALMAEQADRARRLRIRAAYVNSSQEPEVRRATLEAAERGDLDLLFLSPERTGSEEFVASIPRMEIKGIVIDEAHCISQWGHDFRPEYRRLVHTVAGLGLRTPVLALTATAPPRVIEDIESQIAPGGERVTVVRLPSHRPNLAIRRVPVRGIAERLGALLTVARNQAGEPGIAYCLTTRDADIAADFLRRQGITAVAYYSNGLDDDVRVERLEQWQSGRVRVICATSSLGMGMDRADVRWIVHLGLPVSLVQYVQEIGRAGRDGKLAWGIALDDPEVHPIQESFVRPSPDPDEHAAVVAGLRQGPKLRRDLVEALDIPENTVQGIVDELVAQGLCTRAKGAAEKVWRYTWRGGPAVVALDWTPDAQRVKQRFLDEVRAWPPSTSCRSEALARAMGDSPVPGPCGRCDRCAGSGPGIAAPDVAAAEAFLAVRRPRIGPDRKAGLEEGRAIAWHRVGALGVAIAHAKLHGP